MTRTLKIAIYPICLLAASCALCAGAGAESGLTAAQILDTQIGARSAAMGRAFTAVPGGPESLGYNPGGLAFVRGRTLLAGYMKGFAGGGYGLLAAAIPAGRVVLTPGITYFNSGKMNISRSDMNGQVTAEEDKVGYLSAALLPIRGLGVGIAAKYARLSLAETASASSFNYDVGALYGKEKGLSLGAAYLNGGGNIKFEEKGDPPPKTARLGAAYKVIFDPPNALDPSTDLRFCSLLFSADWVRVLKERGYYQAGGELMMGMPYGFSMSLRFGYMPGRTSEGTVFGVGFAGDKWAFDYSAAPSKTLGSRQQAAVAYLF